MAKLKTWVLPSIGFIVIVSVVYGLDFDIAGCNRYFNTTGDHPSIGGKCYVPGRMVCDERSTTRTCTGGILGIGEACTEIEKPDTVCIRTTKCIVIETGEAC